MKDNKTYIILGIPIITTVFVGAVLASSFVSADDSVVDEINITVPVSCTLSGTGMNTHTAEIGNGLYRADIGTTTLKAFCNDNNGFAIYAVGFTDDEPGKNVLTNPTLSSTFDIETGTALSGSDSTWAMKLAATSGTYTPIIAGSSTDTLKEQGDPDFTSFQEVPDMYAKVAYRTSSTDIGASAEGSILTTTYQAYISPTQPAGTYTGQVKYTLVHPANHDVPVTHPAVLDTGQTVNSKLKSLATTVVNGVETAITPTFDPEENSYDWEYAYDEYIKSISVHLETPTPAGFTPSEANTISASTSRNPIYIVFDNTNDAGIMHFYTEGERIVLAPDSSFMFYLFANLAEVSGISDWETSNVTDMGYMFYNTGPDASTFALNLSSWDTHNVTDMSWMFYNAGYSATTWSIGDLSSWDTSSVTSTSYMFHYAGYYTTTWSVGDLSSWNTSNVTDMSNMFNNAGSFTTSWTVGDLSSWNTSNVTNMSDMFSGAGINATTWSIGDLSSWNTSNVTDMSYMFSGAGINATTWSIGNLSFWNTSNVTDMSYMFSSAGNSATSWTVGDLSSWNTSNVTNMSYMFRGTGNCATSWTVGDLSSWNTSNVTNMSYMFESAGINATTWYVGNLSSWNTSNVTNMSYMFLGAAKTTWSIGNLSSWNTSNVTNMAGMFYNAGYSATSFVLNLSSWNTSNVTNMSSMFTGAGYSATTWSIGDLSSWNTSNVTNMYNMFKNAGYSTPTFSLNLSSWNTSNVTNMSDMFTLAGYSATSWSVIIPRTNGNNINNTASRLYGKTTSVYGTRPANNYFTLAQP